MLIGSVRTRGWRGTWMVTLVAGSVIGYPGPARADDVRDGQWHLDQLSVADAHALTRGQGVTVAVLDSGVDASHPDLRDNVLPGLDLTGGGTDGRDDPVGSGTALAGLVAGHGHGTGQADGVLGLAPAAEILPVVVAPPRGSAEADTIAAGIDEAARRGADVICVGRPVPDDPAVTLAVGAAIAAGAVVVMPAVPAGAALARYGGLGAIGALPSAAGEPAPPGADPPGAGVPGGDPPDADPPGAGVPGGETPGALAVPGVAVLSTGGQGGYFLHVRTGGAAAAAVLAGAAALLRAEFPQLPGYQLTHRMMTTAGPGGLDLGAALTATVPPPPAPPPPPTGGPAVVPAPPTPAATVAAVAAFDSPDWRRWLVGAPLVGFLVLLVAFAVVGARRARGSSR